MIDHGDDDDDEDYHFEKYYDSEKYNDNDNNFTGLAYMAALCSYRGSLNPARALGPAFVANRFFLSFKWMLMRRRMKIMKIMMVMTGRRHLTNRFS